MTNLNFATNLNYAKAITGPDLKAWRARLGYTQAAAAAALGISVSQLADYESGMKRGTDRPAPIPRVVALACRALETGKASNISALSA